MTENERQPIMPPEGPEGQQVTPEEQKRIEESGWEFEAEKQAAQQSRKRQTRPAMRDYADQSKILEGQQKRILRAKIANLAGPKEALPSDFAVHRDLNDDSVIQIAKAKKFWERFKSLFK